MNVSSVLRRLRTGDLLSYSLGRFYPVRRIYATANRVGSGGLFRELPLPAACTSETIFEQIDTKRAVTELKNDAVTFGFNLPTEMVDAIHAFALEAPLHRIGEQKKPDKYFHYRDVVDGRLPDGQQVSLGNVVDPPQNEYVARIRDDRALWRVCTDYLGYQPQKVDVRLWWSFATANLTEGDRRKLGQTIDYHIDIHDFNFCYAHFYLTDTDAKSGAHVMITGSHHDRRFKWLLGSARVPDEVLHNYYDPARILTIEGPKGTGFIEDTSCYHKAPPPIERDRLLLQLRFH